jgi:hypothetical protein
MMAIADQQNRRRARHQQYQSEQARNLAGLIGAVDDVGEEADADAMEKAKAEALASDTGARKTQAEAALLRAKTAAGANADAILRKKTESEAKAEEKETVLRKKESGDVLRARIMAGDQFKPDIPTIDDPALGGLDDTSLESVTREATGAKAEKETKDAEDKRKADAKIAADEALAASRTADAEKKKRGPGPAKPMSEKEKALTRKAQAEATKAERELAGAGGAGGVAAVPKGQAMSGELAEKRALKVQGLTLLGRLREAKKKVGTGPIEGRAKDLAGVLVSNPERRKFAQLNNAVQRVAGRILEGGKLAEGDARVYEKFILDPNSLDDGEYVELLDSIQTMLEDDLTAFDQEQAAAGRVVGPRSLAAPSAKPATAKVPTAEEDTARLAAIAARKAELKAKR